MNSKNILIVEDDSDINHLLAEILTRSGYHTVQAYSGTEAELLLEQKDFALIILDLMLPGKSGEELILSIRKTNNVPVIVLSAKEGVQHKVQALRTGADDYMTKPFDPDELTARIEAALRRANGITNGKSEQLLFKDIHLDRESRTVAATDKCIELTAIEFAILELLMSNPKKVFTKANLYHSVWNDEFYGDDNTINVHISKLRSKLGQREYIQTVWGIGYKMQE